MLNMQHFNAMPYERGRCRSGWQYNQPEDEGERELPHTLDGATVGLLGAPYGFVETRQHATWNIAESQTGMENHMLGIVNIPKILELDINRMMIGQNAISAQIGSEGVSKDRLVNAANSNLRSYLTVTRPGHMLSPNRSLAGSRHTSRPSTSQICASSRHVCRSTAEFHVPNAMSSSSRLQPLSHGSSNTALNGGGGISKGRQTSTRIPVSGVEDPYSSPDSSLRQTPPDVADTEMISLPN